MKTIRILLYLVFLCVSVRISAQLKTRELPVGFHSAIRNTISTATMPMLDIAEIKSVDRDCHQDSLRNPFKATRQTRDNVLVISSAQTVYTDQQLYSHILIINGGQLTIQSTLEMMGSYNITVESGGKLIVDGGTILNADIELQSGSSLEVDNDGVIETRNELKALLGSTVEITKGLIY